MKRNLLLVKALMFSLAGMLSLSLAAKDIDEATARQKAEAFMQKRLGTAQEAKMRRAAVTLTSAEAHAAPNGDQPLYIFNREGGGYVIVSGDDRAFDILGYGFEGEIDPATMPANMRAWLNYYAESIAALGDAETATRTPAKVRKPIEPSLTTTWNQSDPYNRTVPYYTYKNNGVTHSEPAVTGCTATAMAQVMYYHRYPNAVQSYVKGYNGEFDFQLDNRTTVKATYYAPPVMAGTPIDWDNMLPSYERGTTYTDANVNAVATLMQYLGTAFSMNYGPESGATVDNVLYGTVNAFGYTDAYIVSSSSYATYDEWVNRVYEELEAAHVIGFDGQSRTLGGHMFVIDGYEGEDYFHVNWGWGGLLDGNFKLAAMNPYGSSAGFNTDQHFFAGLGPEGKGYTTLEHTFECTTLDLGEEGQTIKANFFNNYSMNLKFVFGNYNFTPFMAYAAVGIYDTHGNLELLINIGDDKLEAPTLAYYTVEGSFSMPGLDDGVYLAKPIYSTTNNTDDDDNDDDAWRPMLNADKKTVYLIFNNGTLTISYDNIVGISAPKTAARTNDGAWRTLDGRLLQGRPTTPGIYIRGNEKVLIKDGQPFSAKETDQQPFGTRSVTATDTPRRISIPVGKMTGR